MALFFCFLESNQVVYENHLPLSGQQWLLQPLLCLQVEFKGISLFNSKEAESSRAHLLKHLMKVLLCLSSFLRKYTKWPFLMKIFKRGGVDHFLYVPLTHFFCSTLHFKMQRPTSLLTVAVGWSWHRLVLNWASFQEAALGPMLCALADWSMVVGVY